MNKGRRRITFVFFWARFDCALRNGFCSEQSPAHAAVAVDCRCYRFVVPFRFIPFSLSRLRHSKLSTRERSSVRERETAMECKQLRVVWVESVSKRLLKRCLCVRESACKPLSLALFLSERATLNWAQLQLEPIDETTHNNNKLEQKLHTHTHTHVLSSHSHALPLCCALYLSLSLKPLF